MKTQAIITAKSNLDIVQVLQQGLPTISLVLIVFATTLFICSKIPKVEETDEEKEQNRVM